MLGTTLAAKGCRGFGYVGRKNDTAKKVAKALSALSTNWFRSWPHVSWGMPPIWIEPGGLLSLPSSSRGVIRKLSLSCSICRRSAPLWNADDVAFRRPSSRYRRVP